MWRMPVVMRKTPTRAIDDGGDAVPAGFHPGVHLRHHLTGPLRSGQLTGKGDLDESQRYQREHRGRRDLGALRRPRGHHRAERQQTPEIRQQAHPKDERHPQWPGAQGVLGAR
jgi:hypothetical protein